jgi:hydroxypyruvate reductase 1
VHNEQGSKRVLVTKDLPGTRWLDILVAANLRVEVCAHEEVILSQNTIRQLMSDGCRQCHGVIGQLTEVGHAPACSQPSCTTPRMAWRLV